MNPFFSHSITDILSSIMRTFCIFLLLVWASCLYSKAELYGQTPSKQPAMKQDSVQSPAQMPPAVKDTAAVQQAAPEPELYDGLEILLETRNEAGGMGAAFSTLLTIREGGVMQFNRRVLVEKDKQKENVIDAQLKKSEWNGLLKALEIQKFSAVQTDRIMFAMYRQGLTVKKGTQKHTIMFLIDPRILASGDPKLIDADIKRQLGLKGDKIWRFVQLVRAINNRFHW